MDLLLELLELLLELLLLLDEILRAPLFLPESSTDTSCSFGASFGLRRMAVGNREVLDPKNSVPTDLFYLGGTRKQHAHSCTHR